MEIFKDGVGIIITGTVYNDSIYSTSSKNSNNNVDGLSGNDYISYFGTYSTISGGAGRDHIYASRTASNNEIHGGIDRDTVLAGGNYTKIYGEAGDDSLLSTGDNSTIDGGDDNDEILNRGANVEIYGSTGDDSINNSGSHVTIDSSAFVTLINGSEMTVEGGFEEGFDTVENSGHDVKITTGAGKDSIINIGSDATIIAEDGSKTFTKNSEATIEAGEGNDTIWNKSTADSVSIDAGAGEDYVYNVESSDVSIDGGIDNDRIFNGYYDKENDKSLKGGSNVSINGGAGDDYIENNGGTLADNGSNDTTILGGDDKDTIKNNCSGVTIDGGNGDDSITNERVEYYYAGQPMYRGDEVSINGGDDNNIIGNGLYTGEIGLDFYTNAREFQVDKDYAGGNKVTIETGKGDDSIFNRGSEVTVKADDGKNTVRNGNFFGMNERISALNPTVYRMYDSVDGGENVKIETGKDDDLIQSFNSSKVTIDTGDGNNLVSLSGNVSNISVKCGSNDDTVVAYTPKNFGEVNVGTGEIPNDNRFSGSYLTVEAGGGKTLVSIVSPWNYVTINGSADDDKILCTGGSNILINAGTGEKNLISVTSSSSEVTIEGADTIGADLIYNESNGALIRGNAGYDDIKNSGVDVYMYGGADDDFLTNYGDNAHIYGEGGEDYIYSDNATGIIIDGGANDDDIFAYHDIRALVLGGSGDDRIYMNRVSVADRNELLKDLGIDSFNAFVSLLKSANPKTENIPFTVGGWWDWLAEIGGSIINAVADEKLLIPSIMGSMGNTVKIAKGAQPWITAISAVMTIWKYLDPNSLLQQLNTATSTVNGGKGNDIIFLDGFAPRVVSYSSGDGNDVIYHMATNQATEERTGELVSANHLSTLQLENGTIDDVTVNGNNVKLNIGTGSVELVDAACFRFKVREADGTLTTRIYGTNDGNRISSNLENPENNLIIDGMGGNDYIYNYAHDSTISGGAGNDYIYNGGSVSYRVRLNGDAGNDYIYGSNGNYLLKHMTINGGIGDDKIELMNVDNALIEYSSGDGNDTVYRFDGNDTLKISALSYTLERKGFDLIVHVDDGSINLKGCRLLVALGKVNIDGTPENDLVNVEFYDMELDGDKLSLLKLNPDEVVDVSDAPNEIRIIDASKSQTSVKVIGNSSVDKFIGSDKADVFYTEPPATQNSYNVMYEMASRNAFVANDLLSLDSAEDEKQIMTVSAGGGDDTIYGGEEKAKLYVYNAGDGSDVIYNFSVADTLNISGDSYSKKIIDNDVVVKVGNGEITLKEAAHLSTINIDGTGQQSSTTLTLTNEDKAAMTLESGVKVVDASNRSKSIQITGNALDNSILGGKVADTLCGGTGNDTLTGYWKGDLFIYTAGNDVITDYNPSAGDKVSLAGDGVKYLSHITGVDVDGSDVKLTFSKDSNETLTLNGVAGKKVVLNGATRYFTDNQLISYDKKSVTLTSAFSGAFNAGNYKNVNATAVTQAVTISGGNSGGVSIVGSSKADSIVGTVGNDTLTGGYGADTYVYTGGNDVITDYAANFDRISLAGGNSAKWLSHITGVSVKNKNVTLTFSNDVHKTLTLNGAAGKKVILNGTTRIFDNGMIYTYDKKKSTVVSAAAESYWFDEHDFTQGAQLDSIVDTASAYSIDKLEIADNLTRLTKDEFILTFGDK